MKQDRFQPLSEAEHLAWLLAYGEGYLDQVKPEQVAAKLTQLLTKLPAYHLDPEASKQQWLSVLAEILAVKL